LSLWLPRKKAATPDVPALLEAFARLVALKWLGAPCFARDDYPNMMAVFKALESGAQHPKSFGRKWGTQ